MAHETADSSKPIRRTEAAPITTSTPYQRKKAYPRSMPRYPAATEVTLPGSNTTCAVVVFPVNKPPSASGTKDKPGDREHRGEGTVAAEKACRELH